MQLEEELGVRLFTRGSHRIVLTDEGVLLKRRAKELMSLVDKTKSELKQSEYLSGEISIGSGEYRSGSFFSEILAAFNKLYPNVKFNIFSGNSDNIKEKMERGTLDAGVLLEPVDVLRYGFLRIPFKEEWCAVVSENSPLALKSFVTPVDLAGVPLAFSCRDYIRSEITNWFGDYADSLNIVAEGNLLYNLACTAYRCGGAAIGIRLNCEFNGMKYVPLKPEIESNAVLVWKKNQIMSAAVSTFIVFATKYIKSISDNLK